jgi:hypothetical protein
VSIGSGTSLTDALLVAVFSNTRASCFISDDILKKYGTLNFGDLGFSLATKTSRSDTTTFILLMKPSESSIASFVIAAA